MENSEKAQPELAVVLGETTYPISASFGVLCRFQKHIGKNPMKKEFWDDLGPVEMVGLLWAAISYNNEEITLRQVEDNFNLSHCSEIKKLAELMMAHAAPEMDQQELEAAKADGDGDKKKSPGASS